MNGAPATLRVSKDRTQLTIVEQSGAEFWLSAEMMRVMSPSAEVQGHSPEQKKTIGGKRAVTITAVRTVGNYAIRIVFSDGHESGIFSWRYLRELNENRESLWADHLADLKRFNLSR